MPLLGPWAAEVVVVGSVCGTYYGEEFYVIGMHIRVYVNDHCLDYHNHHHHEHHDDLG